MIRRLLQMPLTLDGVRLIDVVIVPIGIAVAIVVCLPILAATFVIGAGIGALLHGLGAPDAIASIAGFVTLGLGLILSFVALVRINRRLPASIRTWISGPTGD